MCVEAEQYLLETWRLSIKPSSRVYMTCQGNLEDGDFEGWTGSSSCVCLGHLLDHSGSAAPCISKTLASAWRSFWANLGKASSKPLSISTRLKQLNRLVTPIVSFRAPRWPFTAHAAKHLDREQRKMIRLILHIQRLPSETPQAYGRRAGRMVSQLQLTYTPWCFLWAERVCTWAAHLIRDTGGASWGKQILIVWSTREVDTRRMLNNSRPGTRINPGFTCRRWTETVHVAATFSKTSLAKPITKLRVFSFSAHTQRAS